MSTPSAANASARRALTAASLAALLASAAAAAPPPALGQWFPRLHKGSWIKVEGRFEPGHGLRAREVRILHGDVDEIKITTTIVGIDPVRKSFETHFGIHVVTDHRTQVQRGKQHRANFAALRRGDRVEAEGHLQKNGTLLADEVEIKKSEKNGEEPGGDSELTGRIESVDPEAHKVVVLGIPVFFDAQTKNKTPFLE